MPFEMMEIAKGPKQLNATTTGTLNAGEMIQIRVGTPGDITTILQEEVPEGASWELRVWFQGIESDA